MLKLYYEISLIENENKIMIDKVYASNDLEAYLILNKKLKTFCVTQEPLQEIRIKMIKEII